MFFSQVPLVSASGIMYGNEITQEFESEVSGMTAYAAGLLAKGEARGEARGEEKGRKLLTYGCGSKAGRLGCMRLEDGAEYYVEKDES